MKSEKYAVRQDVHNEKTMGRLARCRSRKVGWRLYIAALAACALNIAPVPASAAFTSTLPTPAGSVAFGSYVAVLPNGNIVVVDYNAPALISGSQKQSAGAVYLYSPNGVLINFFSGSTPNDNVGSGGITVLRNGNFVVASPGWHNQGANAGAVTWVDGAVGMSGTVSESNSIVGTNNDDRVGRYEITALENGNYVIRSPVWDNVGAANAGAVTWCNGLGGTVGPVSQANSLVGVNQNDQVGSWGIFELTNGNYVVSSPNWSNNVGAVTWEPGATGVSGIVGPTNSLVGSSVNDNVGSEIEVLPDGNYVVGSMSWANYLGAVTYANGSSGLSGYVGAGNSLVGVQSGDRIGNGGIVVLSNGNYVVVSPDWYNASVMWAGAVTWADGSAGLTGTVGTSNSLVGTTALDMVGFNGVTALANGNYVVATATWNSGAVSQVGAATWIDGSGPFAGTVSAGNSVIGSLQNDNVAGKIVALPNGNYVVVSNSWNFGSGAVTMLDGTHSTSTTISSANSLVSTYGSVKVTVLTNGNFVVGAPQWRNASSWKKRGQVHFFLIDVNEPDPLPITPYR
jgi:Repeat of unknown function (DUF5650)